MTSIPQDTQERIERTERSYDYIVSEYDKLKEAMEATNPAILFCGPWFSGKTRLLPEKAYFLSGMYPGYKSALVRKERVHLEATTWKFLTEYVIPRKVLNSSYYNKSKLQITFANGSEIVGYGLEDAQKIASTEFGFIGVEEAIEITKEEDFNWIESRARQPDQLFHQVMYCCNAGPPSHYLYQRFYLKNEGLYFPGDRLIEGEVLWDLAPESYKVRLSGVHGKFKERFIFNRWVGFEGLIYDVFSPEMIVDRFEIPDDWTYVIGIDFGFHNPFVCQFWAISPDDVWYLEREIYMSGRTINRLSSLIKRIMEERNLINGPLNKKNNAGEVKLRQFYSYSDHDAEDQATLKEHGISTRNASKEVIPGIQTVYDRMVRGQVKFFRDAPVEKDIALEMAGKPTSTVEEIGGYIWASKQKDEPKKENDHGCFSAGTLIETDRGQVAIEDILPGDFVLTRAGYQRVIDSEMTDFFGNTFFYEFSDGRKLIATKNHPVFVEKKGMVPISALQNEDTLCIMNEKYREELRCQNRDVSYLTEGASGVIRRQSNGLIEFISKQLDGKVIQNIYTAKFGNLTTGKYPQITPFITRMEIHSIIPLMLQIMNFFLLGEDIKRCFIQIRKNIKDLKNILIIWKQFGYLLKNGIDPMQEKNGISNTGKSLMPRGLQWKEPAWSVEKLMPLLNIPPLLVFAPMFANQKIDETKDWMKLLDVAQNVEKISKSTNTQKRFFVPGYVRLKSCGPSVRQPVYNLTIENHHEYFANGILVSNCDSMRYAMHSRSHQATPGFFFAGRSYERETKVEEKKQPSRNIRDRFIDRFDRGD